jgi:hypothetical protein
VNSEIQKGRKSYLWAASFLVNGMLALIITGRMHAGAQHIVQNIERKSLDDF